jgi:hypothetical protein
MAPSPGADQGQAITIHWYAEQTPRIEGLPLDFP